MNTANEKILKEFRKRKVVTLQFLVDLGECSAPTARRRLRQWGAISSYNQNGRFYTLPDIPKFDANGLWQWKRVSFSKFKTLKQTVVELVCRSVNGLDGREIGTLLGLNPRSFLSAFSDHPQLLRRKVQGRYVYYAADLSVFARQQKHRRSRIDRLPSDVEAVAILVEKIKMPVLDNKAMSQRLRRQNISVEPEVIENLFSHHGLAVKKTPHSD